ncbi:MAG: hypothetical protein WCG27_04780 [Pseudomonadota bacterium]
MSGNNNDDDDEINRFGKGVISDVVTIVPNDIPSPFQFGDVVPVKDKLYVVICTKDSFGGCDLFLVDEHFKIIYQKDRPFEEEGMGMGWDFLLLPKVASWQDLPKETQTIIEKYRKWVDLWGIGYSRNGVNFFVESKTRCEPVMDYTHWMNRRFDLLRKCFVEDVVRVFSKDNDVNSIEDNPQEFRIIYEVSFLNEKGYKRLEWRHLGPMPENEVEKNVEDLLQKYSRHIFIRKGVYDFNENAISKIEIYQGMKRVQDIHLLKGRDDE